MCVCDNISVNDISSLIILKKISQGVIDIVTENSVNIWHPLYHPSWSFSFKFKFGSIKENKEGEMRKFSTRLSLNCYKIEVELSEKLKIISCNIEAANVNENCLACILRSDKVVLIAINYCFFF
jgi:hypothetical protein